jgi:hypothetical protein
MANNVYYTDPGTGKLFATDEVSSTHYQQIKLVDGTPGASGYVPGDQTNGLWVHVTKHPPMSGDVPHDGINAGSPVQIGVEAVSHGINPTAVAAGDRTRLFANRHGIMFTMGGHPNVLSRCSTITDGDGAQTNLSLVGTINTGTKVALTQIQAVCDNANSGDVAVKIGFASGSLAADSTTGASGIILDHPGGGGLTRGDGSAIIGVGLDGEELRLTCEDPVGGSLKVSYSYFLIES